MNIWELGTDDRLQGGMTVCWSTVADVSPPALWIKGGADKQIIGRKPVYLTSFGVSLSLHHQI